MGGGNTVMNDEQIRRLHIKDALEAELHATVEQRADRYLAVNHQNIVAGHHFAAACAECLDIYRDGHFFSTVMVSQAVAEGICRFVLERNGRAGEAGDRPTVAERLVADRLISQTCSDALVRIWQSFRNDVHHMNPKVAVIPFPELAKRNIGDLATIEREIFAYRVNDGKLSPVQPRCWDVQSDGTVPVFLRLHP